MARSAPRSARGHQRPARHPRPWILGLALATIAAVALLGGVLLATVSDRDWHVVATADGMAPITRADLRDRIGLETFLARRHSFELEQAVRAGRLSEADAASIEQADVSAESDEGALQGLLDDRLIDLENGSPIAADAGTELLDFLTADARLHIAWVEVDGRGVPGGATSGDWPRPGTSGPADGPALDTIADRLTTELSSGADPVELATELRTVGWQAQAADTWASTSGAWDGLDPTLLDEARATGAQSGAMLAPVRPAGGRLIVARLLAVATPDTTDVALSDAAQNAAISAQVLDSWAASQALRRTLTEHVVTSAAASPIDQVRGEELAIAAVPAGDPASVNYGLTQVLIDRIAPDLMTSLTGPTVTGGPLNGARLAEVLAAMDPPTRVWTFDRLIASANVGVGLGSIDRSGPIGWFTKDDLLPPIAAAISSLGTAPDEILGPFDTSSGDALFLVTGRYVGALDDQSSAALTQVLASDRPDFDLLADRFDPSDVDRVDADVWHSRLGFAPADSNATALFGTPVGEVSGPIVIDDRLELVRVSEHQLALPDAADLAAYRLVALDQWLASARSSRHAWADPDPFATGTGGPAASATDATAPSVSPGFSSGPIVAPTIPALPTPVLPALPTPFRPNG